MNNSRSRVAGNNYRAAVNAAAATVATHYLLDGRGEGNQAVDVQRRRRRRFLYNIASNSARHDKEA